MARPVNTDLCGKRFGILSVKYKERRNDRYEWLCVCDCGKQVYYSTGFLKDGKRTSCGCDGPRHGLSRTPEHNIWAGILARCRNPHIKHYKHYGGRGISVCERWRSSFLAFLDDMGHRPSPAHSIDRIDVNGDYEPQNCRWATSLEQGVNRRQTRMIKVGDSYVPLVSAVRDAGSVVHHETVWIRIKTGWPVDKALTTPKIHESPNSKARRKNKGKLRDEE